MLFFKILFWNAFRLKVEKEQRITEIGLIKQSFFAMIGNRKVYLLCKPDERMKGMTNKRKSLSQIKLSDLQREKLKSEIKAFYIDERGEEIGMIEQMQLLELFEEKLAPVIYNKALDDAKRWYAQMIENAESDYYVLYKTEN